MVVTERVGGQAGTVLVVGATGSLGGRAARALLDGGWAVRALVREGTDASRLTARGIEIARGDLTDPGSLAPAMDGVDAVVTTAAGYVRRRRGDSLKSVDDQGNRNLVDAARRADIGRFVFTSILTADQAPDVPHFWQKKVIEDYLQESGVPFVALRPGAFLGGNPWMNRSLQKGKFIAFGKPETRITFIHPDEVARALAMAAAEPRAIGHRIDLGADRPASAREVAAVLSELAGRPFKVRGIPLPLRMMFAVGKLFSPAMRDMGKMLDYFETGKYVADTSVQAELFGPVATLEENAAKLLKDAGVEVKGAR